MMTFTCSTLRLNGVHLIVNTIRQSAITLTTGKTLEEDHISSSTMPLKCVATGKQELSSVNTKRVANFSQVARNHMDGKKRCTIH